MLMRIVGYPRINLPDYNIEATGRAEEAFKTGVEAPIEVHKATAAAN
jgi:hypothetical protein